MKITTVVLAAGVGSRMKSDLPKVLHKVGGRTLLEHVLVTVGSISKEIRIVTSDSLEKSKEFAKIAEAYSFTTHPQNERLGTAHALKMAISKNEKNPFLVICGDTPLIKPSTLQKMLKKFNEKDVDIVCLGFKAKDPTGYGRLVHSEGYVLDIIEEKDASKNDKKIHLCNAAVYICSPKVINELLAKVSNKNMSNEYYLTDIVKLANKASMNCAYIATSEKEVMGINTKKQLAACEKTYQQHLRNAALENGVTLIDPSAVYLSADTVFGKDVIIHPNVVISSQVTLGNGVEVLPFSMIEDATIGDNSSVGPFARIRPKTKLGKNCKVGNFVEIKASVLKDGVKASHLSYIGDAEIGNGTNIGAGTIFCNYDGFRKHKTEIGKNVSIGANSALIAPVKVEDGSIIGAGSVITEDIEKNTLSIARARQVNFKQKAELIRRKLGG